MTRTTGSLHSHSLAWCLIATSLQKCTFLLCHNQYGWAAVTISISYYVFLLSLASIIIKYLLGR
jgi:hypothetical protein